MKTVFYRVFSLWAMVAVLCAGLMAGPANAQSPAQSTEQRFASVIEDLPLMAGMEEAPDMATVFDTPGGRIAHVYVYGPVSKPDVLAFYRKTLPQLGWKAGTPGTFERDQERLEVNFTAPEDAPPSGAGQQWVHFFLAPSAP